MMFRSSLILYYKSNLFAEGFIAEASGIDVFRILLSALQREVRRSPPLSLPPRPALDNL